MKKYTRIQMMASISVASLLAAGLVGCSPPAESTTGSEVAEAVDEFADEGTEMAEEAAEAIAETAEEVAEEIEEAVE